MTTSGPLEHVSLSEHPRKLLAQLLRDRARLLHTVFPASTAQRGVWFMQQVEPATHAYHLPFCVHVLSPINPAAAQAALQHLVDRHSMLRTTFRLTGQQVEMLVHGAAEPEFVEIDARDWTDDELRQRAEQSFRRPFDLQNGPLVRLHLFSRSETEHVFLLVLHHLICDGWSLALVVREFMECYKAEIAGRTPRLLARSLDFPEYVVHHRQWLAGPAGEKSKAYWLERLAGELPLLDLPASQPRQELTPLSSAVHLFEIDESLYRKLTALAQSCGVTLFNVLLAAYQVLLMRLSGQQDIVVGVPMAGRTEPGCDRIVGHFVNLVAIRENVREHLSFRELVGQTWIELQGAVENQEFPFLELIKILRPASRSERTPLFRAFLNILKPAPDHPLTCVLSRRPESMPWGPFRVKYFPVEPVEEHYDLALRVVELNRHLQVKMQYDCKLFDAALIEHFARCLMQLLESVTADPDLSLAQLPLLALIDRERILVSWNATSQDYPRDAGVHRLLAEQVARTPDATAVVFAESKISYRQLDRRANRLARYLRGQGIGRDDLVAVCAERSLELVIAFLAVLKAGAAYVPVDPKYPADRIQLMLQDSGARLVLTTRASDRSVGAITGAPRFCLDRDWQKLAELSSDELPSITDPLDLAYVIYTSGSTGQPKGVQISHRALVNFLCSMRERPGLTAGDVLLSVTTFSFDIFGLELFLPLMVGARLELAGADEIVDGALLAKRLARCGATVMQATPVTWRMLLAATFRPAGQLKALCGGETLTPDLANQLLAAGVELWNMYGPTETTIWSCVEHVPDVKNRIISVGRPVANTKAYVLDERHQPVPIGVLGRLYLGGDGLARGYLRRPELTAEKFIADPFDAGGQQRIYDTGDLARFLPDGRLECSGRSDHQVKIRGYRVELEEIESILMKHDRVAQVVVALREDRPGSQQLAAYYVPAGNAEWVAGADLRTWLAKQLPDYMIPTAFVPIAAIPLTPNGKVDRQKLPVPQAGDLSAESATAADLLPLSENERVLIELWKDLLGLSQLTPLDNFFEIGGHSLLAVQMFARLEALYRRPLPVRLLFSAPTIRQLAQEIEDFPPVVPGPHVFTFRSEGTRPPLILMPSGTGTVLHWRKFVELLHSNRPICGIYMAGEGDYEGVTGLEGLAMQCAKAIAQAYPGVPCHLCGYSFGGILAFEVARQLKVLGCEVGVVAILDTSPVRPITDSFGAMLWHTPQILKNLLSRAFLALTGNQWRRELRALVFKFRLARRRLAAGRSNVEQQEAIAFEYMFGKIQIPDKFRRLLSWTLKLQASYQPQPYRGDLLLVRASKRPLFGPFGHDLGWGPFVDGRIIVANFQGDHGRMIAQAQLLKIAELLTSSFEEFEARVKQPS